MKQAKILKACPCCSGTAHLETIQVRKGWEADIHCNECGLSIHTITFPTKEEAVKDAVSKWNKRVPMEQIQKRFKKMGNIQFSRFSKMLITVEDASNIVEEIHEGNSVLYGGRKDE